MTFLQLHFQSVQDSIFFGRMYILGTECYLHPITLHPSFHNMIVTSTNGDVYSKSISKIKTCFRPIYHSAFMG